MESLENLCRQKLRISKTIPIPKLFAFINKNDGKDLKYLPMIHFKNCGGPYKMIDADNALSGHEHKVLFYRKKEGMYGTYYELFCEREDGEYLRVYSNKKIIQMIYLYYRRDYEEIEDNLFARISTSRFDTLKFIPISLEYIEKLNITYRDVVFSRFSF